MMRGNPDSACGISLVVYHVVCVRFHLCLSTTPYMAVTALTDSAGIGHRFLVLHVRMICTVHSAQN